MPGPGSLVQPKPETRKRQKARETREARAVVTKVRAACVERDGRCRVGSASTLLGPCGGESQWSHLEEKRRFKTRGQEPEVRHTVTDTAMMCTRHHDLYDDRKLTLAFLTKQRADGTMRFTWNGVSVLSVPRTRHLTHT